MGGGSLPGREKPESDMVGVLPLLCRGLGGERLLT